MNRGFSILPDFEPGDEDEDWWDVVEEAPQFGYLNIPVEDVPSSMSATRRSPPARIRTTSCGRWDSISTRRTGQ